MELKRLFRLMALSILFLNLGILCTSSKTLASETDGTERCSSITLENGAKILGAAIDDLQRSSYDLMVSPDDLRKKIYKIPPYNCTIRSKSNFLKLITYVTYVYSDPGQAKTEFNKMRNDFESVSMIEAVPGIGDSAFWAGDNRFQRLVALQGAAMIDILSPKNLDLQKQIISLVLDKF